MTLAGVLLGTAGTLTGQYMTTRVELRRDRRQREEAEHAERKEAVMGFLAAAQRVELALDRRDLGFPDGDDGGAAAGDERLHDLWLAKKTVELVCSHETAQAAHDYTLALHRLVRDESADAGTLGKRERRHAFMEAARRELGADRPALRRR
ncbi:hypothetical protein [Streptomyces macrosporus]|uniref:Protein kilB n=1 Tax=Streptomyces macrosporus TaxID=44032 RepID=A0ABN3K250_9ACTN